MKKDKYRLGLISFGIAPLLILHKEYEEKEMYEECGYILDAINEQNCNFPELKLPTKYSKDTIPDWVQEFNKLGYSGEIAVSNIDVYIKELKRMVL